MTRRGLIFHCTSLYFAILSRNHLFKTIGIMYMIIQPDESPAERHILADDLI